MASAASFLAVNCQDHRPGLSSRSSFTTTRAGATVLQVLPVTTSAIVDMLTQYFDPRRSKVGRGVLLHSRRISATCSGESLGITTLLCPLLTDIKTTRQELHKDNDVLASPHLLAPPEKSLIDEYAIFRGESSAQNTAEQMAKTPAGTEQHTPNCAGAPVLFGTAKRVSSYGERNRSRSGCSGFAPRMGGVPGQIPCVAM